MLFSGVKIATKNLRHLRHLLNILIFSVLGAEYSKAFELQNGHRHSVFVSIGLSFQKIGQQPFAVAPWVKCQVLRSWRFARGQSKENTMVLFEGEEKEPERTCLWGCYFHFIRFFSLLLTHDLNKTDLFYSPHYTTNVFGFQCA